MSLYYQRNQGNDSYPSLYSNFTPIGGSDWSFSTSVGCLDPNTTIFRKSHAEGGRLIPRCTDYDVFLETTMKFNNTHVFDFPDKCLSRVIDKFCTDHLLVPNIVHYVWFGGREFDFIYFVSFYSVFKFQKPCFMFLYYDVLPFGVWWDLLQTLVNNIVFVKLTPPTQISGKKIIYVQHKSDIMRLKILKEYGGIYLDTDQYILRSVNEFRNKECTMDRGPDGGVANAVIFAAKNATFINIWIDSYRDYYPNKWGKNSVKMARNLSLKYPQYIHVYEVNCIFFPGESVLYNGNYKWSHSFAIHFFNKDYYYFSKKLGKLNPNTIKNLNNTIGAVFRYILYGNKELCK
ncbi:uncharacterized protein LOC133193906 [Saccostrea echinata]|uniref:uncharacterized protein LOC133193906 n=1 Tax=Saccostrea echinata TaxID=191078 RepID=UPI002A811CAB|nr:uncharacterized protein LOC133193906 [Saccostrea echinata]